MSQRLGMADGRCFTIHTASGLINDFIMNKAQIPLEDNYSYRHFLQKNGPAVVNQIQSLQKTGQVPANSFNRCMSCDKPLLIVKNTY
jgi:hypothetical protein